MKKHLIFFLWFISFIGKTVVAQDCAVVELAKDFSRNSELKTLLQEDNSFKAWRILFSENPSLRSSVPEIKLVAENLAQIEKAGGYNNWITSLAEEEKNIPTLFFDSQQKFEETVNVSNLPKHLKSLVFQYYKKANNENKPHLWKRIEEIFTEYNINGKHPPYNGGYNIEDYVNISRYTKYDRYCNPIGNWDGSSEPILGGNFTSPIINGEPFDFSSRALKLSEKDYKIRFEIEIIDVKELKGQLADVIPWFNQKGQGKQMMWYLPKDPMTNYPKTWNKLAEEGKIRITIKDVHSSDPNLLKWKGKVIGQSEKNSTFDKVIKENKVFDELKKLGWVADDIDLFNNTFKGAKTIENAQSWKLLRDRVTNVNAHNALFRKTEAVEALTRARALPTNIKQQLGLTDEILTSLNVSSKGELTYSTLIDKITSVGKKLESSPNTKLEGFYDKVLYKLNKNSNATTNQKIGAEGVLKAVDDEFDNLLKGKIVRFENSVENIRGTKSYEDVNVEIVSIDGAETAYRIEVKNCADCITSKVIKEQFIERDLFNASDISQIKWKIYGQNFTKADFEKFLKENRKAIEKLEIGRIEKLLPESMKEGLKQSNMYNRIYNHLLDSYEKIFIN